ncbi:MAG: F0F1 ATP synthase subunit B [Oscillospiraceae bacterium]
MPEFTEFFTIDKWTLLFTWVNMFIMFMIIKKLLFKPVLKILEQRKEQIENMYTEASTATDNAIKMEKDYTEKIALSKDEAGEIIKTATLTAQRREAEILAEAKEKADALTQRAQVEIEQEKKKAYGEIKGEIAEISVAIAAKLVEREINAKDHEALISQFIENVGEGK